MCFESVDDPLHKIALVHVGGNQLVHVLPFMLNVIAVSHSGFFVHDMVGDFDAPGPDVFHNSIIG